MYKIFQYRKSLKDQIEAKSNTNVDKYSESPTIPYIYRHFTLFVYPNLKLQNILDER